MGALEYETQASGALLSGGRNYLGSSDDEISSSQAHAAGNGRPAAGKEAVGV